MKGLSLPFTLIDMSGDLAAHPSHQVGRGKKLGHQLGEHVTTEAGDRDDEAQRGSCAGERQRQLGVFSRVSVGPRQLAVRPGV